MKMTKFSFALFLTLLISGCGGVQKYEIGIEQQPVLVISSDVLVGKTIEVGDKFKLLVSKEDLSRYTLGILGSKDSEKERLQTVVLEVENGKQLIKVSNSTSVFYQKYLYFSDSQRREIRIR